MRKKNNIEIPEFLNLLEEQESTSQELILGEGIECSSDKACPTNEGSGCKDDTCGSGSVNKGGEEKGDTGGSVSNYYYYIVGKFIKKGYSGLEENVYNEYDLPSVRLKCNGVSGSNTTIIGALSTLMTSSALTQNNIGITQIWCSGTTSTNFTTNGGALVGPDGYLLCTASASTHQTNYSANIEMYALVSSAQTPINNVYLLLNVSIPTKIGLREKTFRIGVFTTGGEPIQGVKFNINNANTIFPYYSGYTGNATLFMTGTEGEIHLQTSSTTSNTITGTITRKGFNNNAAKSFTATEGISTTLTLGHTANSEIEKEVLSKINATNDINRWILPNSSVSDASRFQNFSKAQLSHFGFSAVTEQRVVSNDMVLTYYDVIRTYPGQLFYANDITMGKPIHTYTIGDDLIISNNNTVSGLKIFSFSGYQDENYIIYLPYFVFSNLNDTRTITITVKKNSGTTTNPISTVTTTQNNGAIPGGELRFSYKDLSSTAGAISHVQTVFDFYAKLSSYDINKVVTLKKGTYHYNYTTNSEAGD